MYYGYVAIAAAAEICERSELQQNVIKANADAIMARFYMDLIDVPKNCDSFLYNVPDTDIPFSECGKLFNRYDKVCKFVGLTTRSWFVKYTCGNGVTTATDGVQECTPKECSSPQDYEKFLNADTQEGCIYSVAKISNGPENVKSTKGKKSKKSKKADKSKAL